MFDLSWGQIMVIGGVALIVIGPKDLPKALRTVGQMTAKVRRMAGEFQSQFNAAMREAELEDVKREVDGIGRSVSTATAGAAFNPMQTIRDELRTSAEGRPGDPKPPADLWSTDPLPVIGTGPQPIIEGVPDPSRSLADQGAKLWAPPPAPADLANPETAPLIPVPLPPAVQASPGLPTEPTAPAPDHAHAPAPSADGSQRPGGVS